jgi:hypothetical protein
LALGVTPLRVGQEDYWLGQIARNRHEYYSAQGESPGWWVGSLAENVGLGTVATDEAIHRLFAGEGPDHQRTATRPPEDSVWRRSGAPTLGPSSMQLR